MATTNSSSSSDVTPTPGTYAPSYRRPPSVASTVRAHPLASIPVPPDPPEVQAARSNSRIPVTPAVLRAIFSSSRTAGEERSLSRVAFFRFTGFLLSCLGISLIANKGWGIRTGAALLGVGKV
ncbi:hypothetical protein EVG20_g9305 [Dentipellis fragilis]|uniref:Uncharacterized protein n=1 Tax=Dentipellis fragilis TaxID=205917 RepID=A0A4Y9Y179_9AGAM|nr:hypothetical protein EVG20_g9305 [Dentipellis fragilis]